MIELAITRRKRWTKRRTVLRVPSSFAELPQQVIASIGWLLLTQESLEGQLALAKQLIPQKILRMLEGWQIIEIARQMTWFWKPIGVKRPLEKFFHKGTWYYLPADKLEYLTIIEYGFADFAYLQWKSAREADNQELAEQWLDKLVCYLCRPLSPKADPNDAQTWKGDDREQFNTAICERRLPEISSLPIGIKIIVLMYFTACKAEIHKTYKGSIFKDSHTESGTEISGVRPMKPHEWIDLCFGLAGGKFGTLQETMYTQMSLILHELSR